MKAAGMGVGNNNEEEGDGNSRGDPMTTASCSTDKENMEPITQ
jgi:hypothetical protein